MHGCHVPMSRGKRVEVLVPDACVPLSRAEACRRLPEVCETVERVLAGSLGRVGGVVRVGTFSRRATNARSLASAGDSGDLG